jgi:hypothetical protein
MKVHSGIWPEIQRTKEHLAAFVEIAFISILSRRLKSPRRQRIARLTSTNSLLKATTLSPKHSHLTFSRLCLRVDD